MLLSESHCKENTFLKKGKKKKRKRKASSGKRFGEFLLQLPTPFSESFLPPFGR
jgi:hypothetical protein